MNNRLLITLVLAIFGAILAAGAVGAQTGKGGSDGAVSIDLPKGADLPVVGEVLPACSNGVDDEGDGLVDLDDPECNGNPLADDEGEAPGAPPVEQPAPDDGDDGPGGDGGKGSGGGKGNGPRNPPDPDVIFDTDGGKDKGGKDDSKGKDGGRKADEAPPERNPDGSPSNSNPSLSVGSFGPAPIGVPNFIIDRFTIPPFLLPIYQACGTQYGIPWQVLASINRIETAFGTNLNVSTAGALGWMQFMPPTWEAYGVDANRDGRKDPYNPVDAICAAARYLKASGGETDLRTAIFAYNHADWYVDEVLLYAKQYGKLPAGIVDSLTGLTEGAHFPVAAKARYADDISERQAQRRATPTKGSSGNAADVIADSPTRRGIDIFAEEGAPVVAVNDGVIKRIGKNKKFGRFIVLKDAYGNEFTYAGLGETAKAVPVPKDRKLSSSDFKLVTPGKETKKADQTPTKKSSGPLNTEDSRERLYALPERKSNRDRADLTGQLDEMLDGGVPGYETFKAYFTGVLEFDPEKMDAAPLRRGTKVIAGTTLGKIGGIDDGVASHVNFAIEPAGKGARKIDPKPILDGWKLLEATAIYRAAGKNPFDDSATVGQILLMNKSQLQQKVLSDSRIEIYSCGRTDIRSGQIDRRALATLEYLAERGFRPTVTSLKCGHGFYTSSGNVSAHSSGNAIDIAQVNGIPILGNQGRGSITEAVVRELQKLQGSMAPAQIISLMELGGATFAMGDHADHIHVGFTPPSSALDTSKGSRYVSLLEPDQWDKLLNRIGELDQPKVATKPSKASLPGRRAKRASNAHAGE